MSGKANISIGQNLGNWFSISFVSDASFVSAGQTHVGQDSRQPETVLNNLCSMKLGIFKSALKH